MQVSLHHIHLTHGVTDGRSGGKHDSPGAVQLCQVLTLHLHVRTFFCSICCDTGHPAHFGKDGHIFIKMCFIDHNTINAKFFKVDQIILPPLVRKHGQLCFQPLLLRFHLLNHPAFPIFHFFLSNSLLELFHLVTEQLFPALRRNLDFLELRMGHDNTVVVPGRDSADELLASTFLKIPFRGNQDICGRIKAQELTGRLHNDAFGYYHSGFMGNSKPFLLLAGRYHFEGLPSPHAMGK